MNIHENLSQYGLKVRRLKADLFEVYSLETGHVAFTGTLWAVKGWVTMKNSKKA